MNHRVTFSEGGSARIRVRWGVGRDGTIVTLSVHEGRMSPKDARTLARKLCEFAEEAESERGKLQ